MKPSKKQERVITSSEVRKMIPRRPMDSHKGRNGHVLIVAGSRRMSGAAVLSALGALRVGAGLVTVAIIESERSVITHQVPEALTLALPQTPEGSLSAEAIPMVEGYRKKHSVNALAVGPGLSVRYPVAQIVRAILKSQDIPLILDADGLNNIAAHDLVDGFQTIITPHPGELAQLLRIDKDALQQNRVGFAQQVAREHHLVCVLKGHRTIVTDGGVTRINPSGNPAMATGGMGDVLTGVIAGLCAQGLERFQAASAGVYLHGLAADLVRRSDRGLLATEVANAVPLALAKIGIK